MASSLAQQLAKGASINAALLNERSRGQAVSESYLFSPKEARQHDIDSLHALGLNGFLQLRSLQPDIAGFEQSLFSDAAKSLDRTLQSAEQNADLDATISDFLVFLGPFLLEAPTGKVLEWLVRRFRIHEFNVSSIVSVFLPYHETPHFLKMVSILHIDDSSPLRFLQAYKKAAKPLHRPLLINDMLTKSGVARLVAGILPSVVKDHGSAMHRALIAFHTGALLEYVAKVKLLDENIMAFLLPAAMEPLQDAADVESEVRPALLQETILGSYLILAAISQKTHLTSKAVKSFLVTATDCMERVSPKQLVRTLVTICAPQDQLEKLPGTVVKRLISISGIDSELSGAMIWVGSEKFLIPFVESLVSRLPSTSAFPVLESVLMAPQLLRPVAQSAATSLLRRVLPGDASEQLKAESRNLLSQLYQRHLNAVQSASQAVIAEDEDLRDTVEQLVMSLAVPLSSVAVDSDITASLVGSADADATIRTKSIRDLISRLADGDVSESERTSITSTLLLRVEDPSATVLQALYTTSPDVTAQALLSAGAESSAYLDTLKRVLHDASAKPSRDIIRAHLTFLFSHFLPTATQPTGDDREGEEDEITEEAREQSRHVFMDILLPFLLYSKPRSKTAHAVWEILEAQESNSAQSTLFELFGGCVEEARWAKEKGNASSKDVIDAELMPKVNVAVAAKIADNILVSNYFEAHLELLSQKLQDENPHGRTFAYLIARALLGRLTGDQRIEAGHRVLRAMKLGSLEGVGESMRGTDDVGAFLNDAGVGAAVVSKPSSVNTLRRLQVALLSVLPSFPRPANVALEWVGDYLTPSNESSTTDGNRAARYVELLRTVYTVSNSAVSLPILSTYLLRLLFINLGDDALIFLVGLWLSPATDVHIQYAALRHACAFLEAHVSMGRVFDFQTILPALLVAFQSSDAGVRDGAARCMSVVAKLTFEKEAEAVYAFDEVYGAVGSSRLQYLDWADLHKYAKAITEARDSLVHDPEYIRSLHSELLSPTKGDTKKAAGHKQRVLCYIVSHVNGCPLLNVKVALLKVVEGISSQVKAQTLEPTIQGVLDGSFAQREVHGELTALVVSTFDTSLAADLNDPDKSSWNVYEKLLTISLKDAQWQGSRDALLHRLEHGLFAKLNVDRKSQLCRLLLRVGAEDESLVPACKKVLVNVLSEIALITRLLVALQPQTNTDPAAQPSSKRPRVEKTSSTSTTEGLSSLAILVEIISVLQMPGSLELVSCLLETLNKIASSASPDIADRQYVEQLIMSAVENVVQHFPSSIAVPPGAIRVDTLVEILRTSENPQTFHQACLLMASLARIAPDAVLHNVMPVFTFMGSNVFHRDDAYSFRVVQKTVDSIVPVMVSSLKEKYASGMNLLYASRDFVRVFTNAANHVPRHRRINFFSHLVDTLGPEDFLAPVSMLLVDRVSSRVIRQNATESAGSLFLPLAVSERYAAELQLLSLVQLVEEVDRLSHNDTPVQPFLESLPDDEQTHADITAKRRAVALLVFCDHSLKRLKTTSLAHTQKESSASQELLKLLIAVSATHPHDDAFVDLAAAARSAMASTLGVMSAPGFVAGILTILKSGSIHAQAATFELLAERLGNVNEQTRRALTPTIIKIVDVVRQVVPTSQDTALCRGALSVLGAICNTLSPGEESSIMASVPLVLRSLHQQAIRSSAVQVMLAFSSKLGPRAIPHLKVIVKECTTLSRNAFTSNSEDAALVSSALNVLRNLMTSIPTFWGEAEVLQVVELYLDSAQTPAADSADMSLLIRTLAKRASPGVLLPALCGVSASVLASSSKDQSARLLSFIQTFKIAIKAASRNAVSEQLRDLFKTFTAMFDFCANAKVPKIETALTNAFIEVVVKLNETSFRPIFRKLFDWAFAGASAGLDGRKVVFCNVYSSMLDFFKALMVPYMTFAWPTYSELLRAWASNAPEDGDLWIAVLQTVTKALAADEDRVFWRNDKQRQFVGLAVQQVPLAAQLNGADGKKAMSECLSALLATIEDDALAKTLNLDVLMHSRSEDARVRLLSLACAEQLWRAHGEKLLGFVAETSTFIAEAAEDENDSVVQGAHRLKAAVEAVGGSIDGV